MLICEKMAVLVEKKNKKNKIYFYILPLTYIRYLEIYKI